ncbi:hypothetical protein SAMN05444365_10519 [Micromonospora pattaloongensis]|uniref:Uncharacterized protein n=1 Tax=Micromonospora pattaloongensis TaxID=405436 RepID=A0A1H3PTZ6_9ACTN|nr:hypothetical protein [Micromonospora pattaloongensis]SDZ04450.1 hypothetical protein SAMN05444365_10519 [Micromonospora pattaloongensis]
MAPTAPTDAELDVFIRARLASLGIDLDQLPAGTVADPETGSPGRDSVMASLRSFVRTTLVPLAGYQLPAPGVTNPATAAALSQQLAPMLYPSISTEWRK